MLCITGYTQQYIDECRASVNAQLAAYKNLAVAGNSAANAAFEPVFLNTLVLTLDYMFVHRSRTMEKKDGNALNEVRLLCDFILNNGSRVSADTSIRLNPAKSVLQYQAGDEIRLTEADFVRLAAAFFAEIENKFGLADGIPAGELLADQAN
jgi:hypothetical protein